MKRIWIYLSNTFEVVTRFSFRKMLSISSDHLTKLNAEKNDPDILAIYDEVKPLYDAFRSTFSKSKANKGVQKSYTGIFKDMLGTLNEVWVPYWEGKVFNVYPKGTPESVAIFPNNRNTFKIGTYDEIMLGVETLADVVELYEPLKDLVPDVREKYGKLEEARTAQGMLKGKGGLFSDELEQKRVALAEGLYRNLSKLMAKYYKDPSQVERFFKLSLLRKSNGNGDGGVTISDSVVAGGLKTVVFPNGLKPDGATTYSLSNQSNETSLWFYFAATDSTLDAEQKVALDPGMSAEATAADLGWTAEKPLLLVRNIGSVAADFEVVVFGLEGEV